MKVVQFKLNEPLQIDINLINEWLEIKLNMVKIKYPNLFEKHKNILPLICYYFMFTSDISKKIFDKKFIDYIYQLEQIMDENKKYKIQLYYQTNWKIIKYNFLSSIQDIDVIFKIYGERNSGTNYLFNLLTLNFKCKVIENILNNKVTHFWKHNYPSIDFYEYSKQFDKPVIYFIIVRNIEDWIKSMYINKQHLIIDENTTFSDFIRKPLTIGKMTKFKNAEAYFYGNIFQLRYFKLKKILDSIDGKIYQLPNYQEILKNRFKEEQQIQHISQQIEKLKEHLIKITELDKNKESEIIKDIGNTKKRLKKLHKIKKKINKQINKQKINQQKEFNNYSNTELIDKNPNLKIILIRKEYLQSNYESVLKQISQKINIPLRNQETINFDFHTKLFRKTNQLNNIKKTDIQHFEINKDDKKYIKDKTDFEIENQIPNLGFFGYDY
jgi:hypothetical protein